MTYVIAHVTPMTTPLVDPEVYTQIPADIKRLVEYVNNLEYNDEPDYTWMLVR